MFEFKFPDVGEGITEGKLIKWLVKEGDSIKKEQAVAEIETDKAVVEIPSPINGIISKLLYAEHDVVYVGKPMILFDDGSTNFRAPEQSLKPKPEPMPAAVSHYDSQPMQQPKPQTTPQQKPDYTQSTIRSIPIQQNTQQAYQEIKHELLHQEVLALPNVRHYAREKNIDLTKIRGTGRDGRVTMRDLDGRSFIATIMDNRNSDRQTQSIKQITTPAPILQQQIFSTPKDILATPSTRQLARDLGVDISKIHGTGNHGMITREDVQNAKNAQQSIPQTQNIQTTSTQTIPNPIFTSRATSTSEEIIPMSMLRQAISRKMSESWNNAVHVMVSDEADVTDLVYIREKLKEQYEKKGIKLTYMPFFVKAVVLSLQKNPKLNSMLDIQTNSIVQKHYYNIGIATDTEQGLMVPVIKNTENKNILQMAVEINDLAARARNRTIKLDEMQNGTFTITNVGSIAGQIFTQIINYPESAILGIGRIIEKPVVKNGQIVIRKMLTLSCSIDHRIIDGADASRFLKTVIDYLENPESMMMEMV